LTTFIDHRHDSPREELTPRRVSSGRAGNGTDNRQRSYRRKGARRLPPDRKTKMGGNREVFVSCLGRHEQTFEPRHSLVKEQSHPSRQQPAMKTPVKYGRVGSVQPADLSGFGDDPSRTDSHHLSFSSRHRLDVGDLYLWKGNRPFRAEC